MVNEFVLREGPTGGLLSVLKGVAPGNSSVGIGNWGIDVHQVQRVAVKDLRDGVWRTVDEGDLEVRAGSFEVPYGSIVPRKTEVTNLLVPTCIASSHLAYGAYRLESPYMVVGHSAGVAAALTIAAGGGNSSVAVQDVDIKQLQQLLRAQGQILTLEERRPVPAPAPSPRPGGSDTPLSVGPCNASEAQLTAGKGQTLLNKHAECASVLGYSTADNAVVVTATCHTRDKSAGHQNQEWVIDSASHLLCLASEASNGRCKARGCLVRDGHGRAVLGGCASSLSAGWEVDGRSKRVRVLGSTATCLVAGGSR